METVIVSRYNLFVFRSFQREDRARAPLESLRAESRVRRESEVKLEVISVREFRFSGVSRGKTFPKPYQSEGLVRNVRHLHVEPRIFRISVANDDYRLTYRRENAV